MSTTILALHRIGEAGARDRPTLVVERHGSLPVQRLQPLLEAHGFGLVLGPKASPRLTQREYPATSLTV